MTRGQLLRALREERELTQPQLAERAGCSVSTVAHLEQDRDINRQTRKTLSKGLLRSLSLAIPLTPDDLQHFSSLFQLTPHDVSETLGALHRGDPVEYSQADQQQAVAAFHRLSTIVGSRRAAETFIAIAAVGEAAHRRGVAEEVAYTGELLRTRPSTHAGRLGIEAFRRGLNAGSTASSESEPVDTGSTAEPERPDPAEVRKELEELEALLQQIRLLLDDQASNPDRSDAQLTAGILAQHLEQMAATIHAIAGSAEDG